MRIAGLAAAGLLLAGFVVALWNEPDAAVLTPADGWTASETVGALTPAQYGPQARDVRSSVLENPGAVLFRNYRREAGTQPGRVVSPPFRAEGLVSVVVTGFASTPRGETDTAIACSTNDRRLAFARGGVNVNVGEALVEIPKGWCAGELRVEQTATTARNLAGVGSVSALAPVSLWKRSFIGLLPYLAVALCIFSLVGLAGALALRRFAEPLPAAMATIGIGFLAVFYLYAVGPRALGDLAAPLAALASAGLWLATPAAERAKIVAGLVPYVAAWIGVAFASAALLTLAYNGNASWEPNFRFQPAIWSSDAELPWKFAEALRNGYDLESLFGQWRPSDRPPLMTGGHLLVSGPFSAMQSVGNDGHYLRGEAYNMAAIAMNASWAPAMLYLLTATLRLPRARDDARRPDGGDPVLPLQHDLWLAEAPRRRLRPSRDGVGACDRPARRKRDRP